MTSVCSCLSKDLMIWLDAMKKRCPKVMKIKVFIFIVRKKKKRLSLLFPSLGGLSSQIYKELVDYQNKYTAMPIYRTQM